MADIKNAFSKGITALNVKTSNYLEETKLKTYINTLNDEINAIKMELAGMAYSLWLDSNFGLTTELEDRFMQIKNRQEIIAQKQKEIERLEQEEKQILGAAPVGGGVREGVIYCTNCGNANNSVNRFCEKCGTPLK